MSNTDKVLTHVERALNELRPYFIDEAELTFIMRVPGAVRVEMVVSNDDLGKVREVLTRALDRVQHPEATTEVEAK